ncbi:hypothetical protein FRC15_004049 [Serendipita sp. 397]|nr:hypothetical protein FRC15_004049 [Serendipita sp. 397]KAG8834862.1 hypothetical protein FRC18_001395 [Serendipita sp. 400]
MGQRSAPPALSAFQLVISCNAAMTVYLISVNARFCWVFFFLANDRNDQRFFAGNIRLTPCDHVPNTNVSAAMHLMKDRERTHITLHRDSVPSETEKANRWFLRFDVECQSDTT